MADLIFDPLTFIVIFNVLILEDGLDQILLLQVLKHFLVFLDWFPVREWEEIQSF